MSDRTYTIAELERELARFARALRRSALRETTVRTYVDRTEIFLRFLDGSYDPLERGSRTPHERNGAR
jgi:hypothetical protein